MTSKDDRINPGWTIFNSGLVIAFLLLIGAGLEIGFQGMPNPRVGLAMGVSAGAGTFIGSVVGAYNLGRNR